MKKYISIIAALLLITSPTIQGVQAADTSSDHPAVSGETADLSALASSLGADTDCFGFADYRQFYDGEYLPFYRSFTQSYGISSLQILCHNGMISPSDIQAGKAHLRDIELDEKVKGIIDDYRHLRYNDIQNEALSEEQSPMPENSAIKELTNMAVTSMERGEYFMIELLLDYVDLPEAGIKMKENHNIAGIGYTEGNWEIDGVTYDKCILTLDSRHVGFSEDYCIYINSADEKFCIPAYGTSDVISVWAVVNDYRVLNYKGTLGTPYEPPVVPVLPTEKVRFGTYAKNCAPTFTLTTEYDGDINKTVYSDYHNSANIAMNSKYHLTLEQKTTTENDSSYLKVFSENYTAELSGGEGLMSMDIDGDSFAVTTKKLSYTDIELYYPEPIFKNAELKNIWFISENIGRMELTKSADGILISGDSTFKARMSLYDDRYGEGEYVIFTFQSDGDVMVRYDAADRYVHLFIDKDDDGDFETEIQNGDTNCDGRIDAPDASNILAEYSRNSTSFGDVPKSYINMFSDFNNDGITDACDASAVLTRYAELSTT